MISTNSSSSSRSAIRSSSVADEMMFPTTDIWIYRWTESLFLDWSSAQMSYPHEEPVLQTIPPTDQYFLSWLNCWNAWMILWYNLHNRYKHIKEEVIAHLLFYARYAHITILRYIPRLYWNETCSRYALQQTLYISQSFRLRQIYIS